MRKILFAVALVCSIALCWAEDGNSFDKSADTRKCFMLVTRSGKRDTWTATAFCISKTRLLTAAHTFKKSNDQWIVKDGREVHCRVIKIDFDKDIALIEPEEECEAFFRLVSTLKLIGFPFSKPAIESPGKVDSKYVHAHAYFVNGMSGGPLVNEYGDVEGMGVQGEWGKDSYACRAIPASVLAEFIKDSK